MTRKRFMALTEELRPFLEKGTAAVRESLATTLYHLSDEGRFRIQHETIAFPSERGRKKAFGDKTHFEYRRLFRR